MPTDFIMPCCKNILRLSLLTTLLLITVMAARADFEVNSIKGEIADRSLTLNGTLDLGLSSKPEEALSKGIPLDVWIDLELCRERKLIWNKTVKTWRIKRRIRYHALSRQYLVILDLKKPALVENFTSLTEALKYMGSFNELKLAIGPEIMKRYSYLVKVRAQLNIESLPAPLRPVAYASPSWHLSSGWTEWKIQH